MINLLALLRRKAHKQTVMAQQTTIARTKAPIGIALPAPRGPGAAPYVAAAAPMSPPHWPRQVSGSSVLDEL